MNLLTLVKCFINLNLILSSYIVDIVLNLIQTKFKNMDDSLAQKTCQTHKKPYQYICLDQQCKQKFLLCQICRDSNFHKHSKTSIEDIKQVNHKLSSRWDLKDTKIETYYKRIRLFYDKLRKDVENLLIQDQKVVQSLLEKISYFHLPIEANSISYLQFKKQQYERVDKASILKLISEADNGQLNKNLDQQKAIFNMLDVQLNKDQEKLMSIKYILLSKKMQIQLLTPKLQQISKICPIQDMSKVYSLFNSKGMLIRNCHLLYRASQSKFAPKSFFNSCNNIPNCLTIAKLQNGRKVGGFSSLPLVHPEDDKLKQGFLTYEEDKTKRSFIFSLTNLSSFELKDSNKAIAYAKNSGGPIFGLDLNLSSVKAESNLGSSYQAPDGISVDSLEAKVYLLGAGQVPIQQVQIWQVCF